MPDSKRTTRAESQKESETVFERIHAFLSLVWPRAGPTFNDEAARSSWSEGQKSAGAGSGRRSSSVSDTAHLNNRLRYNGKTSFGIFRASS
jgi:hypothetical protein